MVSFTNFRSPEKSGIEPAGSATSPEALRHTVWISWSYAGRVDQSSNGAPWAIARSPKSVKTCRPNEKAMTFRGAHRLSGETATAAASAEPADAVEPAEAAEADVSEASGPREGERERGGEAERAAGGAPQARAEMT